MRTHKLFTAVLIMMSAAAVVLWRGILFPPAEQGGALYFLDVGQGDSELIELPGGMHVLIDGGPNGKALLESLSRVLPIQKKYIDLLVMTHPQADHMTGFIDVLKNYEVGAFISSGRTGDIAAYKEMRTLLEEKKVRQINLKEGDSVRYGEAVFSVLGPSRTDIKSKELNDTCIVLLLKTPQLSALYTGDIDDHTEIELAEKYNVDVDVLKVAHHGSRFSSDADFLKEASPEFSVIEVGKNTYGHPTAQALGRLKESSKQIFRTDKSGIIKITGDNGRLIAVEHQ